jgi:hypothetical protein
MIGTVKRYLPKVLGQSRLTEEQLNTTLISIEAAVTSRPIKQGEDPTALTQAHFLIGEGLVTIPTGTEPTVRHFLTKKLRLKQKLSEDFWKRWAKEYLLELRNFHEVECPVGKAAPTPPRRCRPNSRGRAPQTLVGMGTNLGVAVGTGRPRANGGAPDE